MVTDVIFSTISPIGWNSISLLSYWKDQSFHIVHIIYNFLQFISSHFSLSHFLVMTFLLVVSDLLKRSFYAIFEGEIIKYTVLMLHSRFNPIIACISLFRSCYYESFYSPKRCEKGQPLHFQIFSSIHQPFKSQLTNILVWGLWKTLLYFSK